MRGYSHIFAKIFSTALFSIFLICEPLKAEVQFDPAVLYPVGSIPNTPVPGDYSGNGILDIAVSNSGSNSIGILMGNGDGTFQAQNSFPTGGLFPTGLVSGDFNGNGKLDLAVSNFSSGNVGILFGNGDGTFQAPVTYPVENAPQNLATGVFTNSGFLDLAVPNSSSSSVSILINNGNGTFQPAVNYAVSEGAGSQVVAVGDFNGNGILDLAVANQANNTLSILFGVGDGTFDDLTNYEISSAPTGVAVYIRGTTVNLVVSNGGSDSISVFYNNGDGTFQDPVDYPVGPTPQRVKVADVNGDGFPDIVVPISGATEFDILYGNADGTFQPAVPYALSGSPFSLALGDFNADGLLDVVVTLPSDDEVSVLIQKVLVPDITGISPVSGEITEGSRIIVKGSGFTTTTAVRFTSKEGGIGANIGLEEDSSNTIEKAIFRETARHKHKVTKDGKFIVINDATLEVIVPRGLPPGLTSLRIINDAGTSAPFFFIIAGSSLPPPRHVKGCQINNKFCRDKIINIITWRPPQNGKKSPVKYQIFSDSRLAHLLGVVSADDRLKFEDQNVKKNKVYTYFITAVYRNGMISQPVRIEVQPKRK